MQGTPAERQEKVDRLAKKGGILTLIRHNLYNEIIAQSGTVSLRYTDISQQQQKLWNEIRKNKCKKLE